jgi:hypothetical protein
MQKWQNSSQNSSATFFYKNNDKPLHAINLRFPTPFSKQHMSSLISFSALKQLWKTRKTSISEQESLITSPTTLEYDRLERRRSSSTKSHPPTVNVPSTVDFSKANSCIIFYSETPAGPRPQTGLVKRNVDGNNDDANVSAFVARVKAMDKRNVYLGGLQSSNIYVFLRVVEALLHAGYSLRVVCNADLAASIPHATAVLNSYKVPLVSSRSLALRT